MRKFPFTALCVIAAEGVVCRSVTVGAHFAPTHGLRFQALHLLNFHFTCTLHWCKDCTWLDVALKLRKFPCTALCVIAVEVVVCRPVNVDANFAPTQGQYFQNLHLHSFHFTCIFALVQALYRAKCNHEFALICIHSAVRNYSVGVSLQVHPRRCAFCTDLGFTFSGSPYPQRPFYLHLALAEALYRARCSPKFHGAVRN